MNFGEKDKWKSELIHPENSFDSEYGLISS